MPIPKIDRQAILDRNNGLLDGGPRQNIVWRVVCLPELFVHYVLAVADIFTYPSTFYDNPTNAQKNFSDASIDGGVHGLMTGVPMQDVLDAIQEVRDAIYQTACCSSVVGDPTGGIAGTQPVTYGVGDVPPPVVSSGYASGPTDWTGYGDYLCDVSHAIVDSAIEATNQLEDVWNRMQGPLGIVGAIAAIAAILGMVVTSGGVVLVLGILAAAGTAVKLFETLAGLIDSVVFGQIQADFETYRDDLVCAIVESIDAQSAETAVRSVISANFTYSAIPLLYNWTGWLRVAYSGDYNGESVAQALADSDRFGSTCPCSPASTILWTFDSNEQGWSRGAAGTNNEFYKEFLGNPAGSISTKAGSAGVTLISPDFFFPAGTDVYVSFDTLRVAGSGTGGTVEIFDASNDSLILTSSFNWPPNTSWISQEQPDSSAPWASLAAGTYYIVLTASDERLVDNIQLNFT